MTSDAGIAGPFVYAGLVPFVVFGIGAWQPLPYITYPVEGLIAYAAVVLAFAGAIHWGAALAGPGGLRAKYFIASVMPALIAWLALLLPQLAALIVLLAGFTGLSVFDHSVGRSRGLPPGYSPLRPGLTAVVVLCLASAILALITR